jgi:hypothetical protein
MPNIEWHKTRRGLGGVELAMRRRRTGDPRDSKGVSGWDGMGWMGYHSGLDLHSGHELGRVMLMEYPWCASWRVNVEGVKESRIESCQV